MARHGTQLRPTLLLSCYYINVFRKKKEENWQGIKLGRPSISRPSLLLLFHFHIHLLPTTKVGVYLYPLFLYISQLVKIIWIIPPFLAVPVLFKKTGWGERGEVCSVLWSAHIPNQLVAILHVFQWTQRWLITSAQVSLLLHWCL